MRNLSISISGILFAVSLSASADMRCGGDGPRPLIDITPEVPIATSEIQVKGDIQQAIFLDQRNIALYRNRQGELRAYGLSSGFDHRLGLLSAPFSKLLDPNQENVLVENAAFLWRYPFSTQWDNFSQKALTHGFWKHGTLYSVEPTPPMGNPATFRVMRYTVATRKFTQQCSFDVSSIPDIKLAEGHTYPYFFFHASNARSSSVSRLVVWKYDVERCQAQAMVFPDALKGSPQKVARFENLRSTLVRTNDRKASLLWRTSSTCEYIDTEQDPVFAVRHDLPIEIGRAHV